MNGITANGCYNWIWWVEYRVMFEIDLRSRDRTWQWWCELRLVKEEVTWRVATWTQQTTLRSLQLSVPYWLSLSRKETSFASSRADEAAEAAASYYLSSAAAAAVAVAVAAVALDNSSGRFQCTISSCWRTEIKSTLSTRQSIQLIFKWHPTCSITGLTPFHRF